MKGITLKILLVLLMLFPVPFSCKDKNECLDLYVEPYYKILEMDFSYIDMYYITKQGTLMFDLLSQDFDDNVYPCDSLALYFEAPAGGLLFHSQHIIQPRFSFMQDILACNSKRSGYAGTLELIDKIYVSSNYDFDETHGKDYDLSDIIDIFAYSAHGNESWMLLSDFNKNSPFEAPKRFYLLIKRKPTLSPVQQFVIKYYMKTEPGEVPKYFIINTPVFKVR